MKTNLALITLILLVAPQAFAGSFVDCGFAGCTQCAPEVEEGNIKATDRVLTDLSTTASFAQNTAFRSELGKITSLNTVQAKRDAYLAAIGIDAKNNTEIVNFLGAREIAPAYLRNVEARFNLSPAQAQEMIEKLSVALRGNLN